MLSGCQSHRHSLLLPTDTSGVARPGPAARCSGPLAGPDTSSASIANLRLRSVTFLAPMRSRLLPVAVEGGPMASVSSLRQICTATTVPLDATAHPLAEGFFPDDQAESGSSSARYWYTVARETPRIFAMSVALMPFCRELPLGSGVDRRAATASSQHQHHGLNGLRSHAACKSALMQVLHRSASLCACRSWECGESVPGLGRRSRSSSSMTVRVNVLVEPGFRLGDSARGAR
jgi:hypothetical protein